MCAYIFQVEELHPHYLRAILDQGYNVAWSDADVGWMSNAFTRFYKAHELVAVLEGDGPPELGALSPAGELPIFVPYLYSCVYDVY